MKVGLHQGSALSPFESITKEELCELLFADDLGLMAESKEELQTRMTEAGGSGGIRILEI